MTRKNNEYKTIIYKKISELVPHPKNEYYFDDITNEKWYDLLESIRLNGIYTPVG